MKKAPLTRKPPGNSVLKTLPDPVQEELFRLCNEGSQRAALTWLKEKHGIKISDTTLSKFWEWYSHTQFVRSGESATAALEEWIKDQLPGISADDLADFGQKTFLALSLKDGNMKAFAAMCQTLARLKNARVAESKDQLAWKKLEQVTATLENAKRTPDGGLSAETLTKLERDLKML